MTSAGPSPADPRAARGAVRPARSDADWAAVRRLIEAYLGSLGFDIGFQGLDPELDDPAACYGPPGGVALLAFPPPPPPASASASASVAGVGDLAGGEPAVGFTGVRPFGGPDDAELKRMYLAPSARGLGLGRALGEAAVAEARRLGYRRLLLDTRASMKAACALYRALGFVEIGAYRHNPFDDAVYFALDLR